MCRYRLCVSTQNGRLIHNSGDKRPCIESIVSKLHNGFIIVQNSENQKEEQDKFTEALKEQELLQVEEKTLRLKPLGVDDNWERLLKVFEKTKKSIRVKDFRYERVWKSGRIEAICGWKNPQLMKNWITKNKNVQGSRNAALHIFVN